MEHTQRTDLPVVLAASTARAARYGPRWIVGLAAFAIVGLAVTACGSERGQTGPEGAAVAPAEAAPSEAAPGSAADHGAAGEAPEGAAGGAAGSVLAGETDAVPVVVDLYHDTICPWCRIGHERLKRALEGFDGAPVVVRYHPYQLDASVPPEGVDMRERLAAKYGADKVDGMFGRVTQAGAADGITFRFDKVAISPNTLLSHALVAAAPQDRREALLAAIHVAYFEEGRDIGRAEVLADLWASVGLPKAEAEAALKSEDRLAEVRRDVASVRGMDVRGVPHMVIHTADPAGPTPREGAIVLRGAQPVEAIQLALKQAAAAR